MATLASFFDTSYKQQMEAAFKTPSHDKFFVFSGPPTFATLSAATGSATTNNDLCPLLFTQGFAAGSPRGGGGQVSSLGSKKTFKLPTTGSPMKTISINGFSLITGHPKSDKSDREKYKYNLLKRVYNYAIEWNNGELLKPFLSSTAGSADNGFTKIAYDEKDIFTGIGDSEFYDIPIGLLSICLTKGNDVVYGRYYENVVLGQGNPLVSATVNAPVNLTGNLSFSYSDEKQLSGEEITTLGVNQATPNTFLDSLLNYMDNIGS